MSFSKARIQRFNELTSQVPAPGAYDPKFDSKVKGSVAIIDKSARSNGSQSSNAGDCGPVAAASTSSVCSRASANPTASVKPFRTPQVPRKRAVVRPSAALSCPRAKAKLYAKDHRYEAHQELADLKVELHNKDKTIGEYEQQLAELLAKRDEAQRQHQRDLEAMASSQRQATERAGEEHRGQLQALADQLADEGRRGARLAAQLRQLEAELARRDEDEARGLDPELARRMARALQRHFRVGDERRLAPPDWHFGPGVEDFLGEVKGLAARLKLAHERELELSRDRFNEERERLEQELEAARKLCKQTSRALQDAEDQLRGLEARLSEGAEAHQAELESVRAQHRDEVAYLHGLIEEAKREYLNEVDKLEKSLEEEKTRMKDCADRMIENAEAVTRETLQACRAETEEKVRRIVGETEAKIREATKASEDKCRERLDKETSALSASLSQRELEIGRLTVALEEMKRTAETQESFSQSLQAELDRAEAQLVEKKEELRNLKDQLRSESAEMVARRRRFDVVMAENQASVGALSQRLAQSQADNDALQLELRSKEAELQQCHELLEALSRSSAMLHEQLDSIADSIEHKLERVGQLEEASLDQINLAKSKLLANVDRFKSAAVRQLAAQARQHSEQNDQLKANLRQMSDRLSEASDMLLRLEQANDEQSLQVSKLQLRIGKLESQLDDKNRQIQRDDAAHRAQLAEMNELLARTAARGDREPEGPTTSDANATRQHQLPAEKARKAEAVDASQSRPAKQLLPLKDKSNVQQLDIHRLRQEFDAKCGLLDQVAEQVNEKLKLEARRQIGMGKENHICSPMQPLSPHKTLFPKSANTTPVSSPNKPLRARND